MESLIEEFELLKENRFELHFKEGYNLRTWMVKDRPCTEIYDHLGGQSTGYRASLMHLQTQLPARRCA